MYVYNRQVNPLKQDATNMTGMYMYISRTSPQWQKQHCIRPLHQVSRDRDTSPNIRLVKEALEIKLHPNNMNREKGFKLRKPWNPSTRLLKHSNTHRSGKSQEEKYKYEHTKKEDKTIDNRDTRLNNMVVGYSQMSDCII